MGGDRRGRRARVVRRSHPVLGGGADVRAVSAADGRLRVPHRKQWSRNPSRHGTPQTLPRMSHRARSMPAMAVARTIPWPCQKCWRYIICHRYSTRVGSSPTTSCARSSTAPTTARVCHSRVASPHPKRPSWSVSTLTNTQFRIRAWQTCVSTRVIFMAGRTVSGRVVPFCPPPPPDAKGESRFLARNRVSGRPRRSAGKIGRRSRRSPTGSERLALPTLTAPGDGGKSGGDAWARRIDAGVTVRAGAGNGPRDAVARGGDAACEADERCVWPRKTCGRFRKRYCGRSRPVVEWRRDAGGTDGIPIGGDARGRFPPPGVVQPESTRRESKAPSHADASHRFFGV